ncbi:MAG: chemotaxis protein CheW [Coriobacteriia bacterium]|nr:chemotaxis protein CheW [Coriobacteriia bacterium]
MPRKAKTGEEPAVAPAKKPKRSAKKAEVLPVEQPVEDDQPAGSAGAVGRAVTFRLDDQLYGFPIEVVQEIQQLVELTPLPDAAPALVGLVDLRGLVVPAVDLRVLVGMEPRPFTLETPMVFCRVRDHLVCLIVDSVEDVMELPCEGLQPPSGLYSLADRMLGVCRLPQGLLLVLDVERLVPESALAATVDSGGDR